MFVLFCLKVLVNDGVQEEHTCQFGKHSTLTTALFLILFRRPPRNKIWKSMLKCVVLYELSFFSKFAYLTLAYVFLKPRARGLSWIKSICVFVASCRSCMLQAESEKLRLSWIQAVQASIASAYRESPDNYYIEVRFSCSYWTLKSVCFLSLCKC